jgi:hypothetical protein
MKSLRFTENEEAEDYGNVYISKTLAVRCFADHIVKADGSTGKEEIAHLEHSRVTVTPPAGLHSFHP